MRNFCRCLLIAVAVAGAGCTHMQLSRSTLRQASTTTDLHYHQILSNLASFHCNLEVLPHLAVVGSGGTSVNDVGSVNVELEWDATQIMRELLGFGASREIEEQWTLAPVVNPDKLRAIRCLFQLVVQGSSTDPECDKLLKAYLGNNYMEWVCQGWYCVGPRKDVPKDACYVAHCGDSYVWVLPEGVEGMSRLTLAVLNIATLDPNPPAEQPTTTVQKYYYEDGKLDRIETFQQPEKSAAASTSAPATSPTPLRKDFYNPLQSQIQLQSKRK